jgi:hypothetical protein
MKVLAPKERSTSPRLKNAEKLTKCALLVYTRGFQHNIKSALDAPLSPRAECVLLSARLSTSRERESDAKFLFPLEREMTKGG